MWVKMSLISQCDRDTSLHLGLYYGKCSSEFEQEVDNLIWPDQKHSTIIIKDQDSRQK